MRNQSDMYPYQQFCVNHILENPAAGLFLEMGLGKTVSTLTAVNTLMYDWFEDDKVLVIAPKKVAESVWDAETQNWQHLKHLTVSKVLGSEKERRAALRTKADIYTINRENVPWLVAHYGTAWPFKIVVIDESSSFKSAKSARFKCLRTVLPFIKRMIALTGTPRPNGLLDLWPQLYLLDRGERLGKTQGEYKQKYFNEGKRNGHIVYEYKLKESKDELFGTDIYEKEIYDKIGDICISMQAKDYLQLPPMIEQDRTITLPPALLEKYEAFEREQVMLFNENEITAINAAALTGKLLQFASGALYDESKAWHEIHTEKITALEEDLEALDGEPLLCFYWFKHSAERIVKHLKRFKPTILTGNADIENWNKRKIPFMLLNPASASHGLNLQFGGHYSTWFDNTWSSELYRQGYKRLDRPGQTHSVINRRYIMADTMDERVIEVQEDKIQGEKRLMHAVRALIGKYK